VVVDIVVVVRVEVEKEVGKFVEVEVGKFEKVVMRIARFGEGSLIAGGVLAVHLGFLGLVCPQGTFSQVPSFL
jgi:hypothetical protein